MARSGLKKFRRIFWVSALALVLAAEAYRPSWNLRYTLVGLPAVLILAAAGAARRASGTP